MHIYKTPTKVLQSFSLFMEIDKQTSNYIVQASKPNISKKRSSIVVVRDSIWQFQLSELIF